jgi:hypothetical protein
MACRVFRDIKLGNLKDADAITMGQSTLRSLKRSHVAAVSMTQNEYALKMHGDLLTNTILKRRSLRCIVAICFVLQT